MAVKKLITGSVKSRLGILLCSTLIISSIVLPPEKAHAQDTDDELVIMSPTRQQQRLLRDLALAYQEETGRTVRMWEPRRRGKPWDAATDHAVSGTNGTDMMLTSKLDWAYRADDEDRSDLTYAPLAKQRVNRADSLVGGVEYGVIYPSDGDSSAVQEFLDFVTDGPGRDILLQPDAHHFIPVDASVPEFQPLSYHERKPWEGEKPMQWHAVCHMGARRIHTTQIAEMKKVWMQGYNFVQGGTYMEDGILEFAKEHGIGMMGFPPADNPEELPEDEVERFKHGVQRARDVPVVRGLYAENEDHLPRIWRPTYRAKLGIDDNPELLNDVESNLRIWLRDKHGDLDTLNDRWGTSYESWEDVGLPELPLDWVQKVVEETGFEIRRPGWADTMKRVWLIKLFRDPLRYHAFTKYPRMLDTYRFYREVWSRKYRALKEGHGAENAMWGEHDFTNHAKDLELGPRKGEDVPGFIYTTKSRPDVFLFREVPEFNAMSYDHPACKMPPTFSQMPVDIQQTAQGKPVWNSEHHLYNHDKSSASRVRYTLMQTFVNGQYKSSSYNRARTTEEERRNRHVAATRTRDELQRAKEALHALRKARANADITVLVNEGNRAWNLLPEGPERPELGGAIQAYAHVGALGKQWKYVINEDVSAEHVTGTLILKAPWLLPETVERINNLPSDREVIVVGELPTENEYGEPLPDEMLAAFRSRATVINNWEDLTTQIAPAEGLPETFQETTTAKFWWWSPVHGRDYYKLPVPKLEVRRAKVGDTTYVTVMNHEDYDRYSAPIPWAAGKKVHDYTRDDPALTEIDERGQIGEVGPRIYGEDETTNFITEDIRIFKLTEPN